MAATGIDAMSPTSPEKDIVGERAARHLAMGVGALIALTVVVVLAILVQNAFGELAFTTDDAFIYTGYVKMAFTPGAGLFAYNVGEHSAGTTGIVYYLLLALSYLPIQSVWPAATSPQALEANSWIVAGFCLAALGALVGAFISRVCWILDLRDRWLPTLLTMATMSIVTLNAEFLWGIISGMENPLTALMLVGMASLLVAHRPRPAWIAVAAAGIVTTRPEWAPIASLFPAALLLPGRTGSVPHRLRAVTASYIVFLALVLACFGTMKLYTGQWLPASDGVRVEIGWWRPAPLVLGDVAKIFSSQWGLWLLVCWGATLGMLRQPGLRRLILVPAFLTLFLLMRAYLGLSAMNVRDRYISYIWAVLLLVSLPAPVALLRAALRRRFSGEGSRRWLVAGVLGALLLTTIGTWSASRTILEDTSEMVDVHVLPSKWMAAHLPAHARVAMESAGAIRTFTDLRLVDRVGLTTNHAHDCYERHGRQPIKFVDFLREANVEYVYDYPTNLRQWLKPWQTDLIMQWEPRRPKFSGGRIVLLKFRPDVDLSPH